MKGQRKSCKISLESTEFNPSQVIFPPRHIWFVTLQGGLCSFWAVQHVPGYQFKPQHLLGTTVLTGLEETPILLENQVINCMSSLPPPPSAAFLVFKVLIFQGGKESWRLALIKEESAPKASYFWVLGASSAAHCRCWAHSNSISAVSPWVMTVLWGTREHEQQQIYKRSLLPESEASQFPITEEAQTKLQLLLQLFHQPGHC